VRRIHLDGFHDPRDAKRITQEDDRTPVVRQENPGRQEKMVFLSPRLHHAGQALEFLLSSAWPEPASENRSDTTSRRKRDMTPHDTPECLRREAASRNIQKEPQSLKTRDSAPALDAKGGQNFSGHLRAPWNTRRISTTLFRTR
jgi:hypothetical protein